MNVCVCVSVCKHCLINYNILYMFALFSCLLSGVGEQAMEQVREQVIERVFASGVAARLRSQWDRNEGIGQNDKALKFLGQDFEYLRSHSLQSRRLFEDDAFPAQISSLGFKELGSRSTKTQGVRWMRPTVRERYICRFDFLRQRCSYPS